MFKSEKYVVKIHSNIPKHDTCEETERGLREWDDF
jgi:hypothetical protein